MRSHLLATISGVALCCLSGCGGSRSNAPGDGGTPVNSPIAGAVALVAAPQKARVTDAFGPAEERGAGAANWQSVNVGDLLPANTTVRTGPDAAVLLLLADGHVFRVGSSTTVALQQLGQAKQYGFALAAGEIWSLVQHASRPTRYEVETPSAVVGVSGTLFTVGYNPSSTATSVSTDDGVVTVRHDGAVAKVAKGFETRVTRAQRGTFRSIPFSQSQAQSWHVLHVSEGWLTRTRPVMVLRSHPDRRRTTVVPVAHFAPIPENWLARGRFVPARVPSGPHPGRGTFGRAQAPQSLTRNGSTPRSQAIWAQRQAAQRQFAQRQFAQRQSAQRQFAQRQSAQRQSTQRQFAQRQFAQRQFAQRQSAQRQFAQRQFAQRQSAQRHSAQRQFSQRQFAQRQWAQRHAAQRKLQSQRGWPRHYAPVPHGPPHTSRSSANPRRVWQNQVRQHPAPLLARRSSQSTWRVVTPSWKNKIAAPHHNWAPPASHRAAAPPRSSRRNAPVPQFALRPDQSAPNLAPPSHERRAEQRHAAPQDQSQLRRARARQAEAPQESRRQPDVSDGDPNRLPGRARLAGHPRLQQWLARRQAAAAMRREIDRPGVPAPPRRAEELPGPALGRRRLRPLDRNPYPGSESPPDRRTNNAVEAPRKNKERKGKRDGGDDPGPPDR